MNRWCWKCGRYAQPSKVAGWCQTCLKAWHPMTKGAVSVITMFDSIDVSQIPSDAQAVAGYTSGNWPTFAGLAAKFPNAYRLSIAVNAGEDAQALDIETGDATVADAPIWQIRQKARGIARPALYCSASTMSELVGTIERAGIPRSSVRLWSAHYTGTAHICGPGSCGATSITVDGTQWTDAALGRNLDASLLADGFFGSSSGGWQEAMMNTLPTLQQGDKDTTGQPLDVRRVQLLVGGIGKWNSLGSVTQVAQDGNFGPSTTAAVKRVQKFFGLTQDGVVGPSTWSALVTGSA